MTYIPRVAGVSDRVAGEMDHRLNPAMVSRKLQVVSFCKQYLARWGKSPSYGEIAAAMGIERDHAGKIVKRAIGEGLLHRATGTQRALTDPDASSARLSAAEAHALVLRLHANGYGVSATDMIGTVSTSCPLPILPLLRQKPDIN